MNRIFYNDFTHAILLTFPVRVPVRCSCSFTFCSFVFSISCFATPTFAIRDHDPRCEPNIATQWAPRNLECNLKSVSPTRNEANRISLLVFSACAGIFVFVNGNISVFFELFVRPSKNREKKKKSFNSSGKTRQENDRLAFAINLVIVRF